MRRLLLLGILFTLAACGRDAVGPAPSSISGSYHLTMVDGHVLPFTVLDLGAYHAQVVSGTLTLNSDGTYDLEIGRRIDDSGNVTTGTDRDLGLWSVMDEAITLASTQGGISRTGTVSGDAITLQSSTRVFVLRK